jgi:hypothetical protein
MGRRGSITRVEVAIRRCFLDKFRSGREIVRTLESGSPRRYDSTTTVVRYLAVTQNRPWRIAKDMNTKGRKLASVGKGTVLGKQKQEPGTAQGPTGCPLRRIKQTTGARRETAGDYFEVCWGRFARARRLCSLHPRPEGRSFPRITGKIWQ